jgi:rod shape-determining protein MreB
MRRSDAFECRAVVAEPVTMSADGRHHFRQALRGLFEQVVFLPRPYLTGLGLRQHVRNDPNFPSDDRPVLLVDLGAGSTEICRVGERYPQPGEMAGVAFGGAQVDQLMREALRQEYPAFQPGDALLRSWRENFGFVGEPGSTVVVNVPIDGVERQIVLTNALRRGCEVWLAHVRQMIESLTLGGTAEGVRPARVYLTGGGSRINRLVPVLNESLERSGNGGLGLQLAEADDLSLAAQGALHAARQVRDDQWPRFILA